MVGEARPALQTGAWGKGAEAARMAVAHPRIERGARPPTRAPPDAANALVLHAARVVPESDRVIMRLASEKGEERGKVETPRGRPACHGGRPGLKRRLRSVGCA